MWSARPHSDQENARTRVSLLESSRLRRPETPIAHCLSARSPVQDARAKTSGESVRSAKTADRRNPPQDERSTNQAAASVTLVSQFSIPNYFPSILCQALQQLQNKSGRCGEESPRSPPTLRCWQGRPITAENKRDIMPTK